MTNEETKLSIDYLKNMQEEYIEGEGYERHPLPEWYALDYAIKALEQQPCEDAVSRKRIFSAIHNTHLPKKYEEPLWNKVSDLPLVTPKEKTGRWISFGIQGEIDGQIVRAFTCSKCGAISIFRVSNGNIVNGDLCPNCGAKMIEPQESEDKE